MSCELCVSGKLSERKRNSPGIKMASPIIGIDLGTTYSCVGVLQHGKVEIIANDQGNRTTPSCVGFTDTERLVGEVAKSQAARNPENTVYDAKRLIGRTFNDPKVQEDLDNWPFKVMDDNNRPKIQVEYKGETKRFTAQEISAMVLSKMRSIAEAYLGATVNDAVITVPAYFNDSQRQATKDAATIAGLNAKRIINEPTAAALAYGLDKNLKGDQNVLIFDLGGGTFDVSILTIADGSMFEVLSTAGDTHLGGEDFDNRMVKHFVTEFKRKYKKDVTSSPRAMRKLKSACEQAKRALSTCTEASVEIDSFYQGIYFYSRITRARFEELCIDLFQQTLKPVERALKDADLKKSEIHEVVLVGGSTRIPKVQKLLESFFEGRKLNMSINPDEAVAYGAAVQAAVLSDDPIDLVKYVLLVDVAPLSLGTDSGEHSSMTKIIERNSRIPVVKSASFSPGKDYQTAVHVGVYQGERALVKDNHMLGEFTLSGLRSARRDQVNVIVEFDLNADGILHVSAKEKQTGKAMEITITNDRSRLSQKEIERMIRDAEQFKADDDARRETIETMQTLERYVYGARRDVEDAGHALTETEKRTITLRIGDVVKWMDENTLAEKDEVGQQLRELQEEIEPLLEKVRRSGASARNEEPQPSSNGPTSGDMGGARRGEPQSSRYQPEGSFMGGARRGPRPSAYQPTGGIFGGARRKGPQPSAYQPMGGMFGGPRRKEPQPSSYEPSGGAMGGEKTDSDEDEGTQRPSMDTEEGDGDAMRGQRAAQDLLRGMLGGERGPRASRHGLWRGLSGSLAGERRNADEKEGGPLGKFTPVMEEVD